ncbi:Mur ligase family protein [Verrucomicrobium sp. BvORR034]|uniref:Mur ligase family protein n=1 Tax=Verrucomicrobium sp. BvORR034 TaxID=1396418 RepID=UPI000678D8C7|nr:Mur ligase family protein [Verrucomicrobium sp. BvORR034]
MSNGPISSIDSGTPPFHAITGPVHFIGICGKGMSSLAVALHRAGIPITGSDEPTAYGEPVALLEAEGISFRREFHPDHLIGAAKVVISRQYSRGNLEVEAVLAGQIPYYSLPQFLLEHFLHGKKNLVVAGTKGKTTTTTMLAWILEQEGLSPGYLIGGVPKNVMPPGRFPGQGLNVIEGDDYETLFWDHSPKFAYYRPSTVLLTNVYPDHPEYHQGDESSLGHFRTLICQMPANGLLLTGDDGPLTRQVAEMAPCKRQRVGFEESADIRISNWNQEVNGIYFTLDRTEFFLPITGRHNALNAAMAAVAAEHHGVPLAHSATHLSTFQGVQGRQDLVGSRRGIDLYRDLAYLPESLLLVQENFRLRYPDRRLVLLYQPFIVNGLPGKDSELSVAMSQFDLVLLADVFKPVLCAPVNPGFSDTVHGMLVARATPTHRVGAVESWTQSVPPRLVPGDVVLAIAHPKVQPLLDHVVEAFAH